MALVALALWGSFLGSTLAKKPNFVYVLCDDMNELLGDEAVIKQTRALLSDGGARMSNAFVSSPKCPSCPGCESIAHVKPAITTAVRAPARSI